ncbi:hypothetical protein [Aminipila luticellarii]|uniref:Uncharacterized protein n=1 Tax=Aminipila luticellarii TaxID=2507160 RepID=A0A410PS97_9FIRM|nr:hypothetical protein [Aminipila luticellarii]QAT41861.1 hypothetical protein EQM06_00710 [Aminipila luticellarii]
MTSNEIRNHLINARDEYINLIKSELLGPGSEFSVPDIEHELISSSPMSRYSVGILYPQGNQVNQDNDETVPITETKESVFEDESAIGETEPSELVLTESKGNRSYEFDETADENLDEEIELSAQYMPSSMGITFIVKGSADIVRGKVSLATYRNAKIPDCVVPYTPANGADDYVVPSEFSHIMNYDKEEKVFRLLRSVQKKEIRDIFERDTISETDHDILKQPAYRLAELCRSAYVREPHNDIEFVLDFSGSDYIDANRDIDGTTAKVTALRTKISEGIWSLSIMLVNGLSEVPAKAYHCIYQPVLEISSADNDFVFIESSAEADIDNMDDEEQSLDLLYRDKKIFGTGLGVSVDWSIDKNGDGSIWSDYFPISEVPPMSFDLPSNDKISVEQLSMKYLSDLDKTDKSTKLGALQSLVDLYKTWVVELEGITSTLDRDTNPLLPKTSPNASELINECILGLPH